LKIAIIIGTRPEIIKTSPIIRECSKRELDYLIIHTNQHYEYELDKIFFDDLQLPQPLYNLNIGSDLHGAQTGKMLKEIEKVLLEEKPNIVLVQGDTNTTLAGALASVKLHIPVGHVESGMRSFDRKMPEEINRVLVDHSSDYLFCPTNTAQKNLLREGIDKNRLYLVGDTIVDAITQNSYIVDKKSTILSKLHISSKKYFLLTLHRAENVDSKKNLQNIVISIERILNDFDIPIVFPVHPRTLKRLTEYELKEKVEQIQNLQLIEPVGYFDFLKLEKNAEFVLTDSGGVQEECCILGTKCVTLREQTEWIETIDVGANMLVGTNKEKILEGVNMMLKRKRDWKNPFGDGRAGEIIVNILKESLSG
jgi:UDP-N-acetylglucosamine 2-epimerase (non-hydrolysing)